MPAECVKVSTSDDKEDDNASRAGVQVEFIPLQKSAQLDDEHRQQTKAEEAAFIGVFSIQIDELAWHEDARPVSDEGVGWVRTMFDKVGVQSARCPLGGAVKKSDEGMSAALRARYQAEQAREPGSLPPLGMNEVSTLAFNLGAQHRAGR